MTLLIKYFSITKSFSDGLNLYFKNLRLLFPIVAIIGIALLILGLFSPHFQMRLFTVESAFKSYESFSYSISSDLGPTHILLLCLISIYKAFLINFCLKIYDHPNDSQLSYKDFLDFDFDILSYLLARLRYVLTAIAGLILFVIPGLIWIAKYYFAQYFIVDRKFHVGESFAASTMLTKNVKEKLWLFMLIKGFLINSFIVSFTPLMALFVYLAIFIPISIFAKLSIYKQLLNPKAIV